MVCLMYEKRLYVLDPSHIDMPATWHPHSAYLKDFGERILVMTQLRQWVEVCRDEWTCVQKVWGRDPCGESHTAWLLRSGKSFVLIERFYMDYGSGCGCEDDLTAKLIDLGEARTWMRVVRPHDNPESIESILSPQTLKPDGVDEPTGIDSLSLGPLVDALAARLAGGAVVRAKHRRAAQIIEVVQKDGRAISRSIEFWAKCLEASQTTIVDALAIANRHPDWIAAMGATVSSNTNRKISARQKA